MPIFSARGGSASVPPSEGRGYQGDLHPMFPETLWGSVEKTSLQSSCQARCWFDNFWVLFLASSSWYRFGVLTRWGLCLHEEAQCHDTQWDDAPDLSTDPSASPGWRHCHMQTTMVKAEVFRLEASFGSQSIKVYYEDDAARFSFPWLLYLHWVTWTCFSLVGNSAKYDICL